MAKKLPSKAEFWGVREREFHILLLVTHWFNRKSLQIRNEDRRIGTHHDPPLKDLFRAADWDYRTHQQAHERLLNNGLLQEQYVCRRKIDWGPTQQGLQAIRECLEPWADQLRPEWADETTDGPTFGDPNEGVVHRKGVEVAGDLLRRMPWTHDHRGIPHGNGRVWYPTDRRGQSCHDLHIDTNEHVADVGVEVVTTSNNISRLVDKWERLQKEDRLTLWVFDNRKTACQLYNNLDSRGEFLLDGQFTTPANWSADAINKKVWRSSATFREEPAGDLVQTVTGLLEGGKHTVQELFEAYYSNK
jgi:hypothetical protein